MASQLRKVTGNRRLARDPRAGLQAKISNLPNRLQQRQQAEVIARDTKFQGKQIALQKKGMTQRKREQEAAMGLEAGKLGVNLAMSDIGKKTVGNMFGGAKDLASKATGGWVKPAATNTKPNMVRDINLGGAISSGLTGYGVGKLVGGKNKKKKSLYGMGAGALMGLMSSGQGKGLSGMITGGLSGGMGGYFS